MRHWILAFLLLVFAGLTAGYGYVHRPTNEQPPSVPSSPTFIVDLHVASAMPAAWIVRTNLIDEQQQTWETLSIVPQVRTSVSFAFDILAYGLPVPKYSSDCGLVTHRSGAHATNPRVPVCTGPDGNAKFAEEEHGLDFPSQNNKAIYPRHGSIHEISGTAGSNGVLLPFALVSDPDRVPHIGQFLSFSLPPVVLNVSGPLGASVNTVATFDTEIGMSELRTVNLMSGNAPSEVIRDPAVNRLDPADNFLTSWVWAETDTLAGSPGIPATVQTTPVAISAATDVATQSSETHEAFLSGVAWGIAGGAFVGALQEILGNLKRPFRKTLSAAHVTGR
jgi:hypothetical protein